MDISLDAALDFGAFCLPSLGLLYLLDLALLFCEFAVVEVVDVGGVGDCQEGVCSLVVGYFSVAMRVRQHDLSIVQILSLPVSWIVIFMLF